MRHTSLIILLFLGMATAYGLDKNGFNLDNASLPAAQILQGGPPKDGIPAIDQPVFISAQQSQLPKRARVLGLYINGIAKAYPINILNWHEIVNDDFNGDKVVITYCPLCGTGMAFSSQFDNQAHQFGVSGLLYNSDVLLYDRQTESLWSQILGKAVSGKYKNTRLQQLPLQHTSWQAWRKRHPNTVVLSQDTGFQRNYQRNPYQGYEQSRQLYFQTTEQAPQDYHPKEQVLGISVNKQYKAYPFIELRQHNQAAFADTVAGQKLTIRWDAEANSASAYNAQGQQLPTTTAFWFAWFAFYPQTAVFSAE